MQPCAISCAPWLGVLGQIARTVNDIEAARHWYGEVLGLTHLYSFGKLAFFNCSGVRRFLSEGDHEGRPLGIMPRAGPAGTPST